MNRKILKRHLTAYKSTSLESCEITSSNLCFLGFQPTSGVWSCPWLFFATWALGKSCWKPGPSTVDPPYTSVAYFMSAQLPQRSPCRTDEKTCSYRHKGPNQKFCCCTELWIGLFFLPYPWLIELSCFSWWRIWLVWAGGGVPWIEGRLPSSPVQSAGLGFHVIKGP